jgi:histidinol dehydrogenase
MPIRLDARARDFAERFRAFLATKREQASDVEAAVRTIIADVAARGDAALFELTHKHDRVALDADSLKVTAGEMEAATAACDARALDALKLARDRIEAYHRRQLPRDERFTDALGVELGHRWTAIEAVGLYVPGGTAAYPSSVLMNAVPAKVAGVLRIVMVVPSPEGKLVPLVLAAAKLAGIDEVYRVGGAQAVAALAYGTATIKPVAKIVGPGNAYVAAAKRLVFGKVGIDMIAGPSEVLIVADATAHADWIAADLLAQAEHLEIETREPENLAAKVRNAGAIFLGPHTPEAIGDYVGGSNHVLPTARSARFSSGLGVLDFMKRTSILKCGPDQLRALGPAAIALGEAEGLDAHARSIAMRFNPR